ncbi:MAG: potassium channel protein [Spirochaetes bacterium]|nr:potassium channel protein [Spirochaetota bacterium]
MRNLKISFILLTSTITFGVLGYHFIEDMTYFESLYMTLITISTVGFQEVKPLGTYGRILTMIIIITGIAILSYTIGNFIKLFVEGEIGRALGRIKQGKRISMLKNHFIICGYGRIGSLICKELAAHGKDFLVLENSPPLIEKLEKDRMLFLPVDATSDDALLGAGIMDACGLVTAVGSDADNVFITLTARGLRSDMFILARASDEKNESKLRMAGATRVVSPYLIGGKRMAQILIRPTVVDFIDVAVMEGNIGLQMEEIKVKDGSNLVGKNLVESNLRKDYGVIIVLIKKSSGEMIFNPQPAEVLSARDVLVLLGKKDDMKRLSEII